MKLAKVQFAASLCLAILVGCGGGAPEAGEAHDTRRFGDPYEVIMNESTALPDEPPALFSDTLVAHISYVGGCADHSFDVESDVARDTAWLWIHHTAHGEDCEEEIYDRIEARVPARVLEEPVIVLMNPMHDIPFVLRWGRAHANTQEQPPTPSDRPEQ